MSDSVVVIVAPSRRHAIARQIAQSPLEIILIPLIRKMLNHARGKG
jgi:hypothetical protein